MDPTSKLGEPEAGAQDLTGVLKRALIFPRVPGTPPRIGSPKGPPRDGNDPNNPEGSRQSPADRTDHPGESLNPADPNSAAPPRIGTSDHGKPSSQGEDNVPARIASDKPDKPNKPARAGPDLIGESKDFNTLQQKGRKLDEELHTAIKENRPDVKTSKLKDNYEERDVQSGLVLSDAKDLQEPFKDIGLDMGKKYSTSSIYSNEGPLNKGVVAEGKFFDQDKTIVGERRFATNDKNPDDKKLKSSDIVFLQWERFASHINTRTGKLKVGMKDEVNQLENFVGRNILSRSTVETIETAHKRTNQPLDKKGVFKRGGEGAQKDSFEALLYTDFVASLVHMLKDHHRALGNKRIAEFITYPRTYDPKTQQGQQKIAMTLRFETWKP